jgi:hypothetical protein
MSDHTTLQEPNSADGLAGPQSQEKPALGRRRPQLKAKLLLLAISITIALAMGEIAVRVAIAVLHRDPLLVSEPRAGWALRPNLTRLVRAGNGGQYVISTDHQGHRLTRPIHEQAPADSRTVILLGDSYIQPVGANDEESLGWLLAHDMPLDVVNLAVLGYGTDQELVSLESYLADHPAVQVSDVIVFVTENDFTDVQSTYGFLARTRPHFRIVDGNLVRPAYSLSLTDRLMDVSYLFWFVNSKCAENFYPAIVDPAPGIDLVVACVAEMRAVAARHGARLHVLVHHLIKIAPLSEEQWSDVLRRTGGIDITGRLGPPGEPDPIGYDRYHWNLAGQKRVAAIVREQLEAAAPGLQSRSGKRGFD